MFLLLVRRGSLGSAAMLVLGIAVACPSSAARPVPSPADKLEPALARELALRPEAISRVVYVPSEPAVVPSRSEGRTKTGPTRPLADVQAELAPLLDGIAALLRRTGQTVVYASPYTGIVVAAGDPTAIVAATQDPRIAAVYRERIREPRLDIAKVVTQAIIVQRRGVLGSGAKVKVGIVEAGRIGSHPDLPAARRILCRPGASREISGHKTEVAGVIQSNHPRYTGIAPDVTLIDGIGADFSDAEMMAATDCVIARGAVAVNMSFGTNTDGAFDGFAEYVDRLVYRTGVPVVTAVSDDCTLRMGSPEIAFNDISVGGFSDRNTVRLDDDRHGCDPVITPSFSAYRDPPSLHGDRQQPDVVAPGHFIRTTEPFPTPFPFEDVSGTSVAAPMVTGEIALLQGRAPFPLARQAERVRAIVMASARHNIEGVSRLSDRDGAGGIRIAAADSVLRNRLSWWFATPGGLRGFPHVQAFTAAAGRVVRVALAWAHKPAAGNATVSTNLDLRVLGPAGAVIASSTSFDNNAEIVAFTARVGGTYRIRIDNVRPSPGPEHVGLAVSLTEN